MDFNGQWIPAEIVTEILAQLKKDNGVCNRRILGIERVCKLFQYLRACLWEKQGFPEICRGNKYELFKWAENHHFSCPEREHHDKIEKKNIHREYLLRKEEEERWKRISGYDQVHKILSTPAWDYNRY